MSGPGPGPGTVEDLDQAHHDDQTQSHEFTHSEHILDPGGHTDAGAVDPGQQHWKQETQAPPSGEQLVTQGWRRRREEK